jgi:predicted ATPase
LAAADEHSQKGISQYDCTRHHALAFTFSGHDPGVCAHGVRAINMALSGFPQKAVKLAAEAVTLARSLSHPYSLANAMWASAIVLQVGRQRQSCRDLSSELLEVSQEHDFPMYRGGGMFFSGWATADGGELEQGIDLMEQGLALFSAVRHATQPGPEPDIGPWDFLDVDYAAFARRPSISLRSKTKSIGLVRSASAPPSRAFLLVLSSA